jgi:hypothetical protein
MSANDPKRTFKTASLSHLPCYWPFGQFLSKRDAVFVAFTVMRTWNGNADASRNIFPRHRQSTPDVHGIGVRCFPDIGHSGAFSAEPRRVLMVHAFGHAYSPWSDMAGSFRAELIKQSKEPIDLYEVSLFRTRRRGDRMNACMSAFG